MKKLILILLLFSALKLSAQNYDLIVKISGDSIACRIDSITDTKLYFKMIYNYNWIHTDINKSDIIEYKYNAIDKGLVILKPGSSYIQGFHKPLDSSYKSLYASRYLFAPSAFGMEEGFYSYSTYGLFLHDIQYGFTDKFSLGVGTSFLLNPVYLMATYTHPINDKSAFAIGDLVLAETWFGTKFLGNLFYGLYSRTSLDNNFSAGVGLLITTESEMASNISLAFNISAQLKMSENAYFITENYGLPMKGERRARQPYKVYSDDPSVMSIFKCRIKSM